jgi:four helix bundle protein
MKKDAQEFIVLKKAYDLVVELIPRIHRFPRSFKFTLGDRLENTALDVLQLLAEARWERDRADFLAAANGRLSAMRYLLRLAMDFKLTSVGVLGQTTKRVDEIGRLVGSWRKERSSPS